MSCPDCFKGTIHVGNPKGTEETIHGLPVYVSRPAEGVTPKGLVVYLPDAFGWDFVNNRILADHYATRGEFLVYVPDLMGGKSSSTIIPNLVNHEAGHSLPTVTMSLFEKFMRPSSWFTTLFHKPLYVLHGACLAVPWLIRVRASVVKPRLYAFFQALRTAAPPFPTDDLRIGAAGFCWGGKYTILLAADAPSSRVARHSSQKSVGIKPLIDCGFTAHPSLVNVPGDIEAVALPLSVIVGDNDHAMKGPLALQMKEILEVKKKGDHEVIIVPGAKHGFAQRTATDDPFQMEAAQQAEDQAINWFTRRFN